MFLAIDVAVVVDCCVPSPQEEDHLLPPPLGKVLVTLAFFITLVAVTVTALTVAIAYVDCCEPFDEVKGIL